LKCNLWDWKSFKIRCLFNSNSLQQFGLNYYAVQFGSLDRYLMQFSLVHLNYYAVQFGSLFELFIGLCYSIQIVRSNLVCFYSSILRLFGSVYLFCSPLLFKWVVLFTDEWIIREGEIILCFCFGEKKWKRKK